MFSNVGTGILRAAAASKSVAPSSRHYFPPITTTSRQFHATHKQDILPLIGVGIVLFVGRYSWKALRRMDAEWDDYQWQLAQYEKQHGVVTNVTSSSKYYPGGTLAVDVGTMHMVFAYKKLQDEKAEIVVTRQGARYSFCGISTTTTTTTTTQEDVLVGQGAMEQYFELPPLLQHESNISSGIQLPYSLYNTNADAAKTMVSTIIQSALVHVLDQTNTQLGQVRPVLCTSPVLDESTITTIFDESLGTDAISPTYIPEPVAAIWGAQQQLQLLPDLLETHVIVVDVGAHVTSISLVQRNVVLQSLPLPKFGGETFVHEIIQLVVDSKMPSLAHDAYALPRVYQAAQAAAAELNTQTRTTINIPYIGMNVETKEPLHLTMEVSRSVVQQALQNHVRRVLVPNASHQLSPHLPPPTDLSSLWTSVLTCLLENSNVTPTQVSHLLVVGGGAKHAIVSDSLTSTWTLLTGNTDGLCIPPLGMRSELVALGAASLLPNYHYNAQHGLVRNEE
jgi:molecular chaperone DnaK (HSP70)